MSARGFGLAGIFCLAFLFIPLARSSLLLCLVNIPSQRAIRYHIWLGHLRMLLFTFHGLIYYNAFSSLLLGIPQLSLLQSHPFSVSSSPLDGKNRISLLIKAAGDWTNGLNDNVETNNKIRASVEGPYGNRLPYHLMYEILVLVAGGIGISPFIAVLSDVIHRLLLLACMVGGVVIFGGAVVALWHIWEKRNLVKINGGQGNEHTVNEDSFLENLAGSTTVQYGSRPDFKEIFGSISRLWGDVDVGVIVCGPPNLESSVAAECRSINMGRKSDDPVFHFNSHSFSF
ncbi:hypothetical protein JCGZ_24119 [Jatropha curcas]|uniref:FAD-binding FR-type domain-containing protein n=1 Tax=Jatropha curcas TaxID=180498 RepID=A0A067L5C1_JATCU|nr:hypothetical protein JCGZ_24119 [Jatropha curcas]